MNPQVLCWVIAVVLFVVGAFWNPRANLIALGLAFLTLGFLAPVW